ncbi:hypothetical protein DMH12_15525 [Streptomyces sp. WAC 04229]|uniref:hypothetical protein n=1 Tax=Streptomyces sp. WAC 04229 TaxID=2203206 RepID=UPI000F749CEE|nr:hypothetical protein [Streptomyces sp. WAC 04229]RSN55625.1 hypothetical protein DMH12_15525 [Streptomyces sp. WAC 04229]
MRRPAQHPARTSLAAPGWAHPYTGLPGIAVFYNDGGDPGSGQQAAPVPSPADLANRAPQPPAPVLPQDTSQYVLDKDTGQPMTQPQFTRIMTRENNKGRNKVLRELCEAAGIPFNHEDTDVSRLTQVLKDAETTRQVQMSDDQRRTEELAAREQALADRETAAQQREAEAARRDRETRIRSVLVSLGATGDDLEDAAALLRVPDDATDEQITQAATDLKNRRGVLFGTTAPQTLPPAPSGGPAGGNAPRQPVAGKDAVRDAARARARAMGLRNDDAA